MGKALVFFVTAGDPDLESLPDILAMLVEAGATRIEVGIPYSDPIADGPTIQASSQRALDRGVTPQMVLEAVARAKCPVPIVLMGYYNTVLRMGLRAFAEAAKAAGVAGTILSDLTPEESDGWIDVCREVGLETIFLAAPTSTDARLDEVCRRSTGFVYAVARTGVTGVTGALPEEAAALCRRLKERTDLPVYVGFGIGSPEAVHAAWEIADGAVVGSWLVDLLAREWRSGLGREEVAAQVRRLGV